MWSPLSHSRCAGALAYADAGALAYADATLGTVSFSTSLHSTRRLISLAALVTKLHFQLPFWLGKPM